MLALLMALSLDARAPAFGGDGARPATQVEVKTGALPAAPATPAAPKTLELPTLPDLPRLPASPQLQAPASASAAPKAARALETLGAQLQAERSEPSSDRDSASERLERFFDKIDGSDAEASVPVPGEIDYFPNEKPGLPVPVHHGPLPPPPPIKSSFFRHASRALPAFFVLSHAFVGVEALNFAARGWVLEAGALVMFAGVFTDLAGRTARFFKVPADIEGHVDAFAGIASFVLAPAAILYKTALQSLPWVGLGVSLFFAGAGIFRIVRGRPEDRGLTVHAAAGAMVAMALASGVLPPAAALVMAAATALLGAAMIGRMRFPRYRKVSVALAEILAAVYASFAAPLAHQSIWALAPVIGFAVYFAMALLRRGRQAHE